MRRDTCYDRARQIVLYLSVIVAVMVCGCSKRGSEPSEEAKTEANTPEDVQYKIDPSKKKYDIGVLYWSMNIPGQVAMRKGLEAQAKKLNDRGGDAPKFNLIVNVAGDDEEGMERQVTQMKQMIDEGVDLIIVQPADIASLSESLKLANKKGIPVVAYDQYIIGGKLAAYVTSDNYQAGHLDGEYIASKFDDDYPIKIILVEYPHVSSTVQRVNGFLDGLDHMGQKYKILKTYNAVEPISGGLAGKEILKTFPEKNSFDVLFTVNDGGGIAIVKTLMDAGRDEVIAATVDGDPESVEIIKSGGIIKIDSAQFCGAMGAEALKAASKILAGQKVPNHMLIPVFPITDETVKYYKGWTGDIPRDFKKPWPSETPYWRRDIKIVKPGTQGLMDG